MADELSFQEKVENIRTLFERCKAFGNNSPTSIHYDVGGGCWMFAEAPNGKLGLGMSYEAAVSHLQEFINGRIACKDSALTAEEHDRLVKVFEQYQISRESSKDKTYHNFDGGDVFLMADDHSTRLIPDYRKDLVGFIAVIKYYTYIRNLTYWTVRIGNTFVHHQSDMSWEEVETLLMKAISDRYQKFPYDIVEAYKASSGESYLIEIKRYDPFAPSVTREKSEIYHWLRIDGVRVEALKFVSRSNVCSREFESSDDFVSCRIFEQCTLDTYINRAVLWHDDTPISYVPMRNVPYSLNGAGPAGIRGKISAYIDKLLPLEPNEPNDSNTEV